MRVVALDPGLATGAAAFETEYDEDMNEIAMHLVWYEEIPNGVAGVLDRMEYLEGNHLVVEDFRLDDRTVDPELVSLEIIGALQGYSQRHGEETGFGFWDTARRVNKSGPKDQFPDSLLKRAGYHPRRGEVKGGHSRDAIRIGLWYIVNELKHRPTMERLWPKEA